MEEKDAFKFVNRLISTLPKLGNRIDIRQVMQDQYETYFGICNHLDPETRIKNPLASVEMHPCENFTEASPLYDSLEEYANSMYRDIWGLSVTEFLNLPRYMTKMMREITQKVAKDRTKSANSVLDEALRKQVGS